MAIASIGPEASTGLPLAGNSETADVGTARAQHAGEELTAAPVA